MELPPQVYSSIVRHFEKRADLCTLCLVSRSFQAAAERELYRSLDVREPFTTTILCNVLSETPRLSQLVVEFTISLNEEGLQDSGINHQTHDILSLPSDYLASVSGALHQTTNLRLLHVHLSRGIPLKYAWILVDCSFRLHTFHCDFSWDAHLVSFLSTQHLLSELHISDFNEDIPENVSINARSLRQARTIPYLSTLNCTFTGVVGTLVPGRPVTHVKTCFSSTGLEAKRVELALLLANLRLSTKPLRSLLVADESYTTTFSLEFLPSLVKTFGPRPQLRFVGPLVLPVDGRQVSMILSIAATSCWPVCLADTCSISRGSPFTDSWRIYANSGVRSWMFRSGNLPLCHSWHYGRLHANSTCMSHQFPPSCLCGTWSQWFYGL